MATYTRLSNGSQGEEVKKLQQSLSDAGYSVGSAGVDGIYGSDTEAAVRAYQRDNGIAENGVADDNTLGKLYAPKTPAPQQEAPAPAMPTPTNEAPYSPAYQAALDALQNAQNSAPTYAATYDDQLKSLYDQIVNRDKFSYDINSDALYQQYKDQYIAQGQMAMMDTIGQATALTGGYGNSYAQNAGQQAYQGYLQQLNDVVPELYGAALDRYTAEGDQLMNQYAMLGDLANDEYGRYQDALKQHWQNVSYLQGVADDEYGRQNDRYNRLVDLITTTGYTPNASELQNAGMSENEARAYANYYAQMMGGVGGSGGRSGGGSGGGSGSGSGNTGDDGNTDLNTDGFGRDALATPEKKYTNGKTESQIAADAAAYFDAHPDVGLDSRTLSNWLSANGYTSADGSADLFKAYLEMAGAGLTYSTPPKRNISSDTGFRTNLSTNFRTVR